jgi:RimJ/RimL family protein N-acetyltransferase
MSHLGPDSKSQNTYAFETERLMVDLPVEEDAPVAYDLVGGKDRREVCATLLWDGPDSLEDTRDWIHRVRNGTWGEFGFHWVIRDKTGVFTNETGRVIGAIGTRPRDEPGRADVGYWLGRPYWGNGIMREALDALLDLGFAELGFYKMEADVYTINERGTRLVLGAGMIREGIIRRAHRKYDDWVDAGVYGIMRDEWEARRAS